MTRSKTDLILCATLLFFVLSCFTPAQQQPQQKDNQIKQKQTQEKQAVQQKKRKRARRKPWAERSPAIGKVVPEFQIYDMNIKKIPLSNLYKNTLLIVQWGGCT